MHTALYYDSLFLQHNTGQHPENAARLRAVLQAVESDSAFSGVKRQTPSPIAPEVLRLVHRTDYIGRVEAAVEAGKSFLDTPDCVVSEATYRVALQAAGAVAEAVTAVDAGISDNAFVACRPPGHHAEHAQAMGFCFFNNIAIGTALALEELSYERILIFDFDVHHGNGTQHAFEADPRVLFASIHQHPRTSYPGTGFEEEQGIGDGIGYTLNAPMPPHSDDDAYIEVFDRVLLPRFREFNPQFVLLSAGFDAHRDDPLAQMNLTQRAFDYLTSEMVSLANEIAQGRLVSVLEGGYHLTRLAECASSHLKLLHTSPTTT